MKNNIVSLRSCEDYSTKNVTKAIAQIFDDLGGIERYIQPDTTVLLKANLVEKYSPDKAVTTHPAVVEAIAQRVLSVGARCIIADSPGAFFNENHVGKIYEVTQMTTASANSGAELNHDFDTVNIKIDGEKSKSIEIMDCIAKADVIINVAKFKTHGLAGYTGAVKNLFGVIPGLIKAQMHSLYPELRDFCNFLIDIEESISDKVVLHFVDAVVGMEGNGPTSGTPRIVNRIFAGENPYCVDAVGVQIMNLQPNEYPLLVEALRRQKIGENYDITVVGDSLADSVIPDYQNIHVSADNYAHVVPKIFQKAFKRHFQRRPVISPNKCKGCKKCYEHCPAKAISIQKDKNGCPYAHIDYSKCINCFCCQELCPFHVVKIKVPLGYKIIQRKQIKKAKLQLKVEKNNKH